MEGIKMYIETHYIADEVKIYAIRSHGNGRDYLTIKDNNVIATRIDETLPIPDNAYFLKLPRIVFDSLALTMNEYQEKQGGTPTQQSLRGKVERYDNEVTWLRDTLSTLMYKHNG